MIIVRFYLFNCLISENSYKELNYSLNAFLQRRILQKELNISYPLFQILMLQSSDAYPSQSVPRKECILSQERMERV